MGRHGQRHELTETTDPRHIRAGLLEAAAWSRPGVTLVEIAGELDIYSAHALSALLAGIQHPPDPPHLLLMLKSLKFTDSSGIGVLVAAAKRAKTTGTALVLAETPEFLQKILRITGLTTLLPSTATGEQTRFWLSAHTTTAHGPIAHHNFGRTPP